MGIRERILRIVFSYNGIIRLITKGEDIDKRRYKDNTILMICCKHNIKKEAGLLIKNGANLDLQDGEGRTALKLAIKFGSFDIAEMLIKNGANLEIMDTLGKTAVHYATLANNQDIMRLLEQYNANMDVQDVFGETALFKAILYNKKDVMDFLIDRGLNLNIQDRCGITPMHLAVMSKNEKLVGKLLQKDVQLNKSNWYGQTPLACAVKKGYTKIASLILEKEPNIEKLVNAERINVVDEACMKGYLDMVELLIKNSANITKDVVYWTTARGEENLASMINASAKQDIIKINVDEALMIEKLLRRGQSLDNIKKVAVYNNKTKRLQEIAKIQRERGIHCNNHEKLLYKAVKSNNEKIANILMRDLTYDNAKALGFLLNHEGINRLLDKYIKSDARERINNAKIEIENSCILDCINQAKGAKNKDLAFNK